MRVSDRELAWLIEVGFFPKNLPLVALLLPPARPEEDDGVIERYDYDPAAVKFTELLWCDLMKPGWAKGRPLADMAED